MRALRLKEGNLEFDEEFGEVERKDEVPVRVLLAGVCETDLQLVKGYMGFEGVLGHEFVGIAESGRYAGQRVVGEINCSCGHCRYCNKGLGNHCPSRTVMGILNRDGAFADRVYVPDENLHVVPESVTNEQAVFTEPLAAAFQIAKQLDLGDFENSVVIGDGRLAFLIAQVLRQSGLPVLVVGKHDTKLRHFEAIQIATERLDVEAKGRREFDLAVDCSGSSTGIPTAMNYLRPRGTLVLKTTVADRSYPNLASLVIDEIQVVGSRCGPFDVALEALAKGRIEVTSTITDRFGLANGVQAMERAAEPDQRKVLIEI